MKRFSASFLLLLVALMLGPIPVQAHHHKSNSTHAQQKAQKQANKYNKQMAKQQKKQMKAQNKAARKWNKNRHPVTTT